MKTYLNKILLVACAMVAMTAVQAQSIVNGSMGTSFSFSIPPMAMDTATGVSHSQVLLHFLSPTDCDAIITTYLVSQKKIHIKAMTDCIYSIAAYDASPYVGDANGTGIIKGIYTLHSIRVLSTAKVSLQCQVFGFKFGEAFTVLPDSALGTKYCLSSGYQLYNQQTASVVGCASITAIEDHTTVTINAGQNFVLDRGDVCVLSSSQSVDGYMLSASKRISVVCGVSTTSTLSLTSPAPYVAEMIHPISNWGTTYLVPRYRPYPETYPLTILSSAPNNKLLINGALSKTFTAAGVTFNKGWMYLEHEGIADQADTYVADSAVAISLSNYPYYLDSIGSHPYLLSMIPVERFCRQFLFHTDSSTSTGYARNAATVIFAIDSTNQVPASLLILRRVKGVLQWNSVRSLYGASIDSLDFFPGVIGGHRYASKELNLTGTDIVAIQNATPCMVYLHGDNSSSSYGLAAGFSDLPNGMIFDTIAPVLHYTNLEGILRGTAHDLPEDSSVRSNIASVQLAAGSSNYTLVSSAIVDMQTQDVQWTLSPTDSLKDAQGLLVVKDWASNLDTVRFSYRALEDRNPRVRIQPRDTVCLGTTVHVGLEQSGYALYQWSNGKITDGFDVVCDTLGEQQFSARVLTPLNHNFYTDAVTLVVLDSVTTPVLAIHGDSLIAPLYPSLYYEWYFDGGILQAAKGLNGVAVLADGDYWLKMIDRRTECFGQSAVMHITRSSVQDDEKSAFVQPQPARDVLYVSDGESPMHSLTIRSLLGIAQSAHILGSADGSCSLDVSKLNSGWYSVEWENASGRHVHAFVKE